MTRFNTTASACTALKNRIDAKMRELKECLEATSGTNRTTALLEQARAAQAKFLEDLVAGNEYVFLTDYQDALIRADDLANEISQMTDTLYADLVIHRRYVPAGSISPAGFHPSEGVYLRR